MPSSKAPEILNKTVKGEREKMKSTKIRNTTDRGSAGSRGRRFIFAKSTVTATNSDIGDPHVNTRKSVIMNNGFNDSQNEVV